MATAIKITIDNIEIEVPSQTTILQACEELGIEIPRFCYHERLSVAGNCRMCLVNVKGVTKPLTSCSTLVAPDMKVDTQSHSVKEARKGIMEFLLINHPLDCPICDQAGECDLQDQSLGYGDDRSPFEENKRAVEEKNMGPLVKTIMTRCIHCTRCVRFATEVAGVPEIGTIGRGEDMEITTYLESSLTSELSGNVIDLCPVGALTSKPYAFTARPWELTQTETIDVMDAMGSHIRVDSRGRNIMRIMPRNHDDINEEWLSDKSRFVWDGLNNQRLDTPYIRENGSLISVDWDKAFDVIVKNIRQKIGHKIAALAGDLACVESMQVLKDLMLYLNSPHLDCRQDSAKLAGSRTNYLFNTTIAGIEDADALLLIGTNPRMEAAVLNARIRKRWLQGEFPIGLIGEKHDLTYKTDYLGNNAEIVEDIMRGHHKFSDILRNAKHPMIILGQAALTRDDSESVFAMVMKLALDSGVINESWNGFNVLHLAAARVGGLDLGFLPQEGGFDTKNILNATHKGNIETIFLLGVDEIDMSLLGESFVIYIGTHGDAGAHRADVILPASTYVEKQALYVNMEGRPQMTEKVINPPGEAREDWKIIRALSKKLGCSLSYDTIHSLRQYIFDYLPYLSHIGELTPADMPERLPIKQIEKIAFKNTMNDFYLTNPIARASIIMAECSQEQKKQTRIADENV